MIRLALMTIGFVAVTIALLVFQPGGNRRAGPDPAAEPVVTRAKPAPVAAPASTPAETDTTPRATIIGLPRSGTVAATGTIDDESLRRMTWSTLSNLNHATGRDSAPGQPGSLLHTIVRRSLDESGAAPASPAGPAVYVVRQGDSLVSIAQSIYGDVNMTGPLFAANTGLLSRPDDLRPGQTLILPQR